MWMGILATNLSVWWMMGNFWHVHHLNTGTFTDEKEKHEQYFTMLSDCCFSRPTRSRSFYMSPKSADWGAEPGSHHRKNLIIQKQSSNDTATWKSNSQYRDPFANGRCHSNHHLYEQSRIFGIWFKAVRSSKDPNTSAVMVLEHMLWGPYEYLVL